MTRIPDSHLLHLLMENIPDGIYFKDLQSRFIRINRGQAQHLGLSDPAEAIGKTDFDFFSEEHARQAYLDEQEVIRTGRPLVAREEAEYWPDGRVTWVSTTKMPLCDLDGAIIGTFGISHDISYRKQTEKWLRDSETLYHSLVEALPVCLFRKDRQGRFTFANRPFLAELNLSLTDLVGKTDRDLYPAEMAYKYMRDDRRVIESGKVFEAVEEHIGPDGGTSYVSVLKVPLRDSNQEVIGMQGIFWDVTPRMRAEEQLRQAKHLAEESEKRTRLIVDSAYDAYVAMDANGVVIDWNKQAELTFGWSREQTVGQLLHELVIPPAYRAAHVEGVRRFLSTGVGPLLNRRVEVPALRRDGTEFPVEITISSIRYQSEWIFSAFLHDITERKQAEAELRLARDAAEAASRAKSEFLANMSHEIRTPMNAIIGLTELLLDTPLNAEQSDYLETVKKSADSLLSVINDILDFSKIEAGKLELDYSPFDLRDSLGDTLNTLALRAHQKGLELACHIAPDVPETVIGDPVRLRQILINLVGNAIKFTEGGEVIVDVAIAPPFGSRPNEEDASVCALHFQVRDTGIGIPKDKQTMIFDAFAQADGSTTRRYGGTGLGLAISSRLVQRMGGGIWVESELGQGSTFHFTARFARHSAALERRMRPDPGRLRGLTVLVVDDNATNRFILAETLTQWQMRPTTVASATVALEALESAYLSGEPFALVLLDAHMPEIDGFMLAERIHQHPDLAGATVMMLSSACQPLEGRRCRDLGLAAYLSKPIKQTELYRAILAALGSPEMRPQSPTPPTPREGRALRLLLAEDNLVNQKLAVRLLEKQGHSVVVAANGREAIEAVQKQNFDLVLMDVQMPEMDGFEATGAIRQSEHGTGRHLPILAMTAYAMKGDRERCLESGMDGYVSKPIQPRELGEMIAKLVAPGDSVPMEEAPAPASVVDRNEIRERVGGDTKLLHELIEVFFEDCPRMWQSVCDALSEGDALKLRRAAHTLKGSVGVFGAQAAREAAERLEQLARNGDLQPAAEVVAQLEAELERLKPTLLELERSNL
ncbi:MAG TPA: PAS domain S-box protein [Gemmataceae bacterium]|jgi:PAS domain S-box-containing protein